MRSSEKGRIPSAKPVQESVAYTGHTLRSFGKEKKSAKDCAAVLLWRDITLQWCATMPPGTQKAVVIKSVVARDRVL